MRSQVSFIVIFVFLFEKKKKKLKANEKNKILKKHTTQHSNVKNNKSNRMIQIDCRSIRFAFFNYLN